VEFVNVEYYTYLYRMITKETLLKIMPNANHNGRLDAMLPFLLEGMKKYAINTRLRQNHFIAQLAHESGEFRYMEEIASGAAYEGRKDLGNTEVGDGIKFKGRGLIQLTGRANYAAITKALGIDFVSKPELLSTPKYAVLSACWFWNSRGLNIWADADDILRITKKINGGTTGLSQREMYLDRAEKYNI